MKVTDLARPLKDEVDFLREGSRVPEGPLLNVDNPKVAFTLWNCCPLGVDFLELDRVPGLLEPLEGDSSLTHLWVLPRVFTQALLYMDVPILRPVRLVVQPGHLLFGPKPYTLAATLELATF